MIIASKIAARAYSKKKILDKQGINPKIKFFLIIFSLAAVAALMIILVNIINSNPNSNMPLLVLSHLMLAPSLFGMYIVALYNWKSEVKKAITFNEMVKNDLDHFFAKINVEFT